MEAEKIKFSHNGQFYEMTQEEIEAAYNYQRDIYQREDARRNLNYLVFETYDTDDLEAVDVIERILTFEEQYNISYRKALDIIDLYVKEYNNSDLDGLTDENVWYEAIDTALRNYNLRL